MAEDRPAQAERPDEAKVSSRADGRPPEEAPSSDPEGQARAILTESEERTEGAAAASVAPDGETPGGGVPAGGAPSSSPEDPT